ncbi:hypothetical protein EMIT047CA2_30103 [Pseudomonas soli]
MHVQGMAQVADGFVDFRRAVMTAQGTLAHLDAHAHAIEGNGLFCQGAATGIGDGVKALAALDGASDQLGFLEVAEGRVDHPGAGAVAAVEEALDLADQVVAVARLLGQHRQHQQFQVARGEYPWATFAAAGAAFEGIVVTHGEGSVCLDISQDITQDISKDKPSNADDYHLFS